MDENLVSEFWKVVHRDVLVHAVHGSFRNGDIPSWEAMLMRMVVVMSQRNESLTGQLLHIYQTKTTPEVYEKK